MSKEVENKICHECESTYRIVYDLSETSGFGKFCPFCSAEIYNDDDKLDIEESED